MTTVQTTPTSKFYLDRQAETESNARTYPRKLPVAIRRAEGLYVTDVDGRVFMDCLCGAGTLAHGHNHPAVTAAIRAHLDEGYPLHTLDLTTPVKHKFVEELLSTLPPSFAAKARIQFCSPSGADAVKAAIKLVKTATRRQVVLGFESMLAFGFGVLFFGEAITWARISAVTLITLGIVLLRS